MIDRMLAETYLHDRPSADTNFNSELKRKVGKIHNSFYWLSIWLETLPLIFYRSYDPNQKSQKCLNCAVSASNILYGFREA